jgi:pyridoxamine 5'-phosphate oxidase
LINFSIFTKTTKDKAEIYFMSDVKNENTLDVFEINEDPLDVFLVWYEIAKKKEKNPDAMVLSTVGLDGKPNSRVVLLKKFGKEDGFIFFTSLLSQKSQEIEKNCFVSLLFWWENTGGQVKIRGKAKRVSEKEADEYFSTRPRIAKISAWASQQSQPLKSYEELLERFERLKKEFEGKDVPRPPYWLGFRVIPFEYEFLIYTQERLHKRILYYLQDEVWKKTYLNP